MPQCPTLFPALKENISLPCGFILIFPLYLQRFFFTHVKHHIVSSIFIPSIHFATNNYYITTRSPVTMYNPLMILLPLFLLATSVFSVPLLDEVLSSLNKQPEPEPYCHVGYSDTRCDLSCAGGYCLPVFGAGPGQPAFHCRKCGGGQELR